MHGEEESDKGGAEGSIRAERLVRPISIIGRKPFPTASDRQRLSRTNPWTIIGPGKYDKR